MKSKFTTSIALVGVLAAGTAAAAVNTQALQSRAESTIGASTTTLIVPVTEPVVLEVSATPSVADVVPATSDPATLAPVTTSNVPSGQTNTKAKASTKKSVNSVAKKPAKKKVKSKPKPTPTTTGGVIYGNPNPGEEEDDD